MNVNDGVDYNELFKSFGTMVCKSTGIHDFVPYKPGTMICSRCGIFAKVGALYMRTGNPDDLIVKGENNGLQEN